MDSKAIARGSKAQLAAHETYQKPRRLLRNRRGSHDVKGTL